MDGNSLNITQDLIEKLKELVPQAFTEDKLDVHKLQTILGDAVNTENERYQLSWAGKSEAYKVLQMPTTATLIPQPEQSVNWDESENIFIEGENLEVLKVLQKSYYGKIKMIYIDPPYNTGSDSFIYPDKFSETKEEYLKRIGEKDEEGYMMKEGLFRKNSKENGQFHSNWLNMMLPRLFLARNLLKDDGLIFVSIDDNEVSTLRMLMDEIFGEENFISQIIVQSNKRGQTYKEIAKTHEYLLLYSKSDSYEMFELEKAENGLPFEDEHGRYDLWELRNRNPKFGKFNRPNLYYPIYVDSSSENEDGLARVSLERTEEYSIEVFPVNSEGVDGCWRWDSKKVKSNLKEPYSVVVAKQKRDGDWNIYQKSRKNTTKAKSLWNDNDVISEQGTVEVGRLGMKNMFDHPKPVNLIKRTVQIGTESDDIILDFFAGSGTTAQSIMELNEEDGGSRKYICVQLPEKLDEYTDAFKAGYQFISEITLARIKKVIDKIQSERNGKIAFANLQNLGFRKYTLSPSNFKIWRGDVVENETELSKQMELFVTPQRANAQSENILWELLIKNGVPLTEKIQRIEVDEVASIYHTSDKRFAFVLDKFTPEVQAAVLALQPRTVICLDSLFQNQDMVKTNAQLKFEDNDITFKTV